MTGFNVCLIQPAGYPHAQALVELGELVHYAIAELGVPSSLKVNQFDRQRVNLLIGAHLLSAEAEQRLPASTIVINTEQLGSSLHAWTTRIATLAQRLEIWDYSESNIEWLRLAGAPTIKFLGLGFQRELARIMPASQQDIDVLFYGSIGERRRQILQQLEARGYVVKTLFGVYGAERDAWIARSRLVLNLHHYETQIFEVVRVFYLLTNAIPVVGEVNPETRIEARFRAAIEAAPYAGLVEACERLLANETRRRELGLRGQALLRDTPASQLLAPLIAPRLSRAE